MFGGVGGGGGALAEFWLVKLLGVLLGVVCGVGELLDSSRSMWRFRNIKGALLRGSRYEDQSYKMFPVRTSILYFRPLPNGLTGVCGRAGRQKK